MKRIISLSLLFMLLCGMTARAQDDFNPADPVEPGAMTTKLKLLADPEEGGSVSGAGAYVPGTNVSLNASPSSGFKFINWTDAAGNVISTNRSFSYTKKDGTETLIAHFSFNPDAPNEPDQLPTKLTLVAGEGGYVSGGGFYKEGVSVNIYASTYSGYDFVGWYYADGTLYSDKNSTTFTMVDHPLTLNARFLFNPDSPSEPGYINSKHKLRLVAEEGGTVYIYNGSDFINEGTEVTIYANSNSGYQFDGWYNGNEFVSNATPYTFSMGASDLTLTAHFNFMPQTPGEPGEIKQRTFSFTLYNVITKPDATVQFPILLTPRATLKDMTFQLNFRPELNVDFANVVLGETTEPYHVSCEDLGIDEVDGLHGYKYTLTGGSIEGDNKVIPILTFPIIIPADAETATSHQIKINQISMTNEDGSTQTAGTRNGRVSIYKLGDANGDDEVNVADAETVVDNVVGKQVPVFIKEVANVDGNDEVDIVDAVKIVNLIVENPQALSRKKDRILQDFSNRQIESISKSDIFLKK